MVVRKVELPDDIMNPGDLTWFPDVRKRLVREWRSRAYSWNRRWRKRLPLACGIIPEDRGDTEPHLSLPCSLASEADHLEAFLGLSKLDRDPVLFLRLYLILLDELCDRMDKLGGMLGLSIQWPTRNVNASAWANHVGKHRLALVVYHHPLYLFLDSPGGPACESHVRSLASEESGVVVVDGKTVDEDKADDHAKIGNTARLAVVVVPTLVEFLKDALGRYAAFVTAAKGMATSTLDRFESKSFDNDLVERLRRACETGAATGQQR
jgi:hypothetical protein